MEEEPKAVAIVDQIQLTYFKQMFIDYSYRNRESVQLHVNRRLKLLVAFGSDKLGNVHSLRSLNLAKVEVFDANTVDDVCYSCQFLPFLLCKLFDLTPAVLLTTSTSFVLTFYATRFTLTTVIPSNSSEVLTKEVSTTPYSFSPGSDLRMLALLRIWNGEAAQPFTVANTSDLMVSTKQYSLAALQLKSTTHGELYSLALKFNHKDGGESVDKSYANVTSPSDTDLVYTLGSALGAVTANTELEHAWDVLKILYKIAEGQCLQFYKVDGYVFASYLTYQLKYIYLLGSLVEVQEE